jgi:hypothetical protein
MRKQYTGMLQKDSMDWEAYEQQKFISHSSEAGKFKIKYKVTADSVSGNGLSSGCSLAVSSQGKGQIPMGPLSKDSYPIKSGDALMALSPAKRPHLLLLLPSHLRFQTLNLNFQTIVASFDIYQFFPIFFPI